MSWIFWDSFDSQDLKRWTTITDFENTGTYKRYGSYGAYRNSYGGYMRKNLDAAETDIYIGFWCYLVNGGTSTTDSQHVIKIGNATADDVFGLWFDRSENLKWALDGGSDQSTGYMMPIGEWLHLQVRLKVDASTGVVQIKYNDDLIVDYSGNTTNGGTHSDVTLFQMCGNLANDNVPLVFDNVIVSDSEWPGNLRIMRLLPNADGNTTSWSLSTGTDHYAVVDEEPPSDSDYAYTNTVNQVEQVEIQNMTETPDEIEAVAVVPNIKQEGNPTPTQIQGVIRTASTDYTSSSATTPTDGAEMFIWAQNPNTTSDWTESDVNGAEIGVKSIA